MVESDKQEFSEMLRDAYAMHDRKLTAGMVKIWLGQLGIYSIEAIRGAFDAYWRTARGLPLPSDILKFLPDPLGHMGPEEAWNQVPKTEFDCGYVTDQMMAARNAADSSIQRGDMIGARMAFVEAYRREVGQAQAQCIRARYWYSNADGLDHNERLVLKEKHTIEAAERKWIEPQKALNLLSAICSEQSKSADQYAARLQGLSAKPLQLTNGLPNTAPKLRLVYDGMRQISEGKTSMSRDEVAAMLPHLKHHIAAREEQ